MKDLITADKTVTTWTCTRCRSEVEMQWFAGTFPQPNDWAKVVTASPPRASVNDVGVTVGILCRSCRGDLAGFLRNEAAPG